MRSTSGLIQCLLFGSMMASAMLFGRWGANELGTMTGAALSRVAAALMLGRASPVEHPWVAIEPLVLESETVDGTARNAPARKQRSVRMPSLPPPAPARGVRVRALTVLGLAEGGAHPVGIPVSASGERPSGILLTNVAGMGIGLQDGDILVSAAGAPALDVGAVISRIIAARGARAPVILGEIWRGGTRFPIVVEQPYLVPDEAFSEGGSGARDSGEGL